MIETQWRAREEQIRQETLEQISRQRTHLLQKESEWAEKIKKQNELSQQLEDKYKNVRTQENQRIIELQNQLHEKQLATERHWSELTNTWTAEKICRDNKIEELKLALEAAKEQQIAQEQAWRAAVEEKKIEKTTQVNRLIEKVKGMEVKQSEIKHDMEQKLRNLQEQAQERYQRNVQLMQEGYKKKYEQEVQRYISAQSSVPEIGTMLTRRESEDKMKSQKKALEMAKQMLHQQRGGSKSPEMDWDYYGTQPRVQEQPMQEDRTSNIEKDKGEEREVPKRAASTPLEEGGYL